MRPKVVSLCDETWKLAMEKENFSEWVRSQLLATDENRIEESKAAEKFFRDNGRWPRWWIQ